MLTAWQPHLHRSFLLSSFDIYFLTIFQLAVEVETDFSSLLQQHIALVLYMLSI